MAGCDTSQIPSIQGKVLDRESGAPITNAFVVITYSGQTRLRQSWVSAAMDVEQQRCVRTLIQTDEAGEFEIPSEELPAYFGTPRVHFKLYHPQFRYRVGGETYAAKNTYTLNMWSESSAVSFDIFTGDPIDYRGVADAEALREQLGSRNRYLAEWLAGGSVFDSCDYENNLKERQKLALALFEQWVSSTDNARAQGSSACSAIPEFELRVPDSELVTRFIALKRAIGALCAG